MEFKKLNILYIATNITGGGGVARILSQKTAAFVQSGHCVQIVSTNEQKQTPFYAFDAQVNFVFYTASVRTFPKMKRYYSFIKNEVVAQFKPDVIFVIDNGIKGYFASYYLNKTIPIYFEVHGSRNFLLTPIQSKLKRNLVNRITLFLSTRFTGLILLNESTKKDWKHANISVIPNWIEIDQTKSISCVNKEKKIIAIGRLVPEKNYETLLKIWKQIQVVNPDWQLVICGSGEPAYVEKLKTTTDASVIWKGEVEEVNQELESSVFMLHTSKMEGMPMAFLEAMALEIPILAFDVPYGPSDLIQDGHTGYLIPFENQQKMIACSLLLMNHPALCKSLGQQAKEAVQAYDKSLVLQQWITFFESLD
ncbi:glycosyltransferase [Myroides odoratus]|uniref:glycosyltransferase n=1 Tax=Myroides odoratus TaxID=256 RepID=UPI0039B0C23B